MATALSAGLSTSAMANALTDTVVDSGRTVFKTVVNPGAVSVELGTLGYGANVAWSANKTTEVVAGYTGMHFDVSTNINDNDSIINWTKVLGKEYADVKGKLVVDVNFKNPYLGVNMRPFSNAFTVGTGVIFQNNTLKATLTPEVGKFNINGKVYDVKDEVVVQSKSGRDLAPYVAVGFKPNSNKRFGMFGELGAVYTGKWDTTVHVSEGATVTGGSVSDFVNDLADSIGKDSLEWYPIVKVGATYRF